jgi:hypothetical protein
MPLVQVIRSVLLSACKVHIEVHLADFICPTNTGDIPDYAYMNDRAFRWVVCLTRLWMHRLRLKQSRCAI